MRSEVGGQPSATWLDGIKYTVVADKLCGTLNTYLPLGTYPSTPVLKLQSLRNYLLCTMRSLKVQTRILPVSAPRHSSQITHTPPYYPLTHPKQDPLSNPRLTSKNSIHRLFVCPQGKRECVLIQKADSSEGVDIDANTTLQPEKFHRSASKHDLQSIHD